MAITNKQKVLDYLWSAGPEGATNSQIRAATGVEPHQQVYMITRELVSRGLVAAEKIQGEWVYRAIESPDILLASPGRASYTLGSDELAKLTPAQFEELARRVMSAHYRAPLDARILPGVPKKFDLVSRDGCITGDAKYFTLVRGQHLPPAKFSVIAEHVWLLEKTSAQQRFLVFGNDREVPLRWLARYGALVSKVTFFFLTDDGTLESLRSLEQ